MTNPHKSGTRRFMIVELIEQGLSRREVFNRLRPMTEQQIEPMIFKANVRGYGRRPKALSDQIIELQNEVNRVFALQGKADDGTLPSDPSEPIPSEPIPTPEIPEEDEAEEDEDEEPMPVKAKGKITIQDEKEKFLNRVREIRKFCRDRERLSEKLDDISMRPALAASKLIPAGIPTEALIDSMTCHWSEDSRHDAQISSFDFLSLSREIMRDRGIENLEIEGDSVHPLFGLALIYAENRQNIMAIGPAGTGKSHLARQLASYLELPYGETPMSPGASRGDLVGKHTIGGWIPAKFCEIYSGGGVFNFEEMDASDPSMLIVLNNALAADSFFNPSDSKEYIRHDDFIAFSTANTFGLGANRDFTARERLDAATIDRWRMARIIVELDENVERSILFN
jgi:AAA domain (dynein-related subfamily)